MARSQIGALPRSSLLYTHERVSRWADAIRPRKPSRYVPSRCERLARGMIYQCVARYTERKERFFPGAQPWTRGDGIYVANDS